MHKPKRDFFKEYFDPPRPTPEEYERYKKMTPGERLEETFRLTAEFRRKLLKEPQEYVDAFFEAVRRDHDEGNRLILEGLARCFRNKEEPDEPEEGPHRPEKS
jgi:hypothetical protein